MLLSLSESDWVCSEVENDSLRSSRSLPIRQDTPSILETSILLEHLSFTSLDLLSEEVVLSFILRDLRESEDNDGSVLRREAARRRASRSNPERPSAFPLNPS